MAEPFPRHPRQLDDVREEPLPQEAEPEPIDWTNPLDDWGEAWEPDEAAAEPEGPTPQDAVHARAAGDRAARRGRLAERGRRHFAGQQPDKPAAPDIADAPADVPHAPQQPDAQQDGADKVAELLQELIEATRAATSATEEAKDAIESMGQDVVAALGEVKAAVEQINTGVQ